MHLCCYLLFCILHLAAVCGFMTQNSHSRLALRIFMTFNRDISTVLRIITRFPTTGCVLGATCMIRFVSWSLWAVTKRLSSHVTCPNLPWHFRKQLSEICHTLQFVMSPFLKQTPLIKKSLPRAAVLRRFIPLTHFTKPFSQAGEKINCSVSDQTIALRVWGEIVRFLWNITKEGEKKGPFWHWAWWSRLQLGNFQTSP